MPDRRTSILYPADDVQSRTLSESTIHDLGLDEIITQVTSSKKEQDMITKVLSTMYADPDVTRRRCEVFADIHANPKMRGRMLEILDRIDFLKDYGTFKPYYESTDSTWDLMHRLDEINDYIGCVEAIHECLSDASIQSVWLKELRAYIDGIYTDNGFEQLKKDVADLKASTKCIASVTLGINLNERYEAREIGLVSINDRPYLRSNALGRFSDFIASKQAENSMHFHPFGPDDSLSQMEDKNNILGKVVAASTGFVAMASMASVPDGDSSAHITSYMDKVAGRLVTQVVKKLKTVLAKYVTITIHDVTRLIPEFVFYVRWAQYFESLESQGLVFCRPEVSDTEHMMQARGAYNLKLTPVVTQQHGEIVANDLDFGDGNIIYILTGANRGGKTTITQAIGQLFVLAQAGLSVPASSFVFRPADNVCTHFPADEDKTLDLGRLGEECSRFREMFATCTQDSLLLLNETFSTTSFEEGYFIACDSVRAIASKGIRTIYNTHMHKLGFEAESFGAKSLIVKTEEGGVRSFRVVVAPPEGSSYAHDIAVKYGVTYEMLTEGK